MEILRIVGILAFCGVVGLILYIVYRIQQLAKQAVNEVKNTISQGADAIKTTVTAPFNYIIPKVFTQPDEKKRPPLIGSGGFTDDEFEELINDGKVARPIGGSESQENP